MNWTGRVLRRLGTEILRRGGMQGVWIDVGAHHGETTIGYALHNPGLMIYAIEPNLRAAVRMVGHAPNFIVIPMAVAETDGCAEFHINAEEQASSLLAFNEDAKRSWIGGEKLRVESATVVPTIRLDTFMDALDIRVVDYLKIDAQGADLAVIRSAGARLTDVRKITLEVDISPSRLYQGSGSRDEVASYLAERGFALESAASQSFGQEENLTFVRT